MFLSSCRICNVTWSWSSQTLELWEISVCYWSHAAYGIFVTAVWMDSDQSCGLDKICHSVSRQEWTILHTENLLTLIWPLPHAPSSFSPLPFAVTLIGTWTTSVRLLFFLALANIISLSGSAFLSSSSSFSLAWLTPSHFQTSTHISHFPSSFSDFFFSTMASFMCRN